MCNMGPRSDAHTLELAGVLERCFLGQYHGFRYWFFPLKMVLIQYFCIQNHLFYV